MSLTLSCTYNEEETFAAATYSVLHKSYFVQKKKMGVLPFFRLRVHSKTADCECNLYSDLQRSNDGTTNEGNESQKPWDCVGFFSQCAGYVFVFATQK